MTPESSNTVRAGRDEPGIPLHGEEPGAAGHPEPSGDGEGFENLVVRDGPSGLLTMRISGERPPDGNTL